MYIYTIYPQKYNSAYMQIGLLVYAVHSVDQIFCICKLNKPS